MELLEIMQTFSSSQGSIQKNLLYETQKKLITINVYDFSRNPGQRLERNARDEESNEVQEFYLEFLAQFMDRGVTQALQSPWIHSYC